MGRALVIVVGLVLFVYALFDLIATPPREVRFLPKPLWFLVILAPAVGPLLWIFGGTGSILPPPPTPKRSRPSAKGPDDDPDYLRGL